MVCLAEIQPTGLGYWLTRGIDLETVLRLLRVWAHLPVDFDNTQFGCLGIGVNGKMNYKTS